MTDFVGGNRLTLLESGREYFPALEAAFDSAKREIHLETYIYADDAAGRTASACDSVVLDLVERQVRLRITADDLGPERKPVRKVDRDLVGVLDDVVVRHDIAVFTNDDARA